MAHLSQNWNFYAKLYWFLWFLENLLFLHKIFPLEKFLPNRFKAHILTHWMSYKTLKIWKYLVLFGRICLNNFENMPKPYKTAKMSLYPHYKNFGTPFSLGILWELGRPFSNLGIFSELSWQLKYVCYSHLKNLRINQIQF